MRKLVIAVVATTLSAIAVSAEPLLQCVNPDILNGILFYGRSQEKMEVTRGLPTAMTDFRTPAEFSVIGTGVRNDGASRQVAFKTAMAGDKAYTAMITAFGVDGWSIENSPGSTSTFLVEGAPRYAILCKNGERRYMTVTELSGVRYANVSLETVQEARACNAPQVMNMGTASMTLRTALPRFQFPAGSSIAQGGGSGGGGSSSGDSIPLVVSATRIITTDTPEKLVETLERQLTAQGWKLGTDLVRTGSVVSTWRKTIENRPAWGTLEVAAVSEGMLDVDFTMTVATR